MAMLQRANVTLIPAGISLRAITGAIRGRVADFQPLVPKSSWDYPLIFANLSDQPGSLARPGRECQQHPHVTEKKDNGNPSVGCEGMV
jgi:hypothetical protein